MDGRAVTGRLRGQAGRQVPPCSMRAPPRCARPALPCPDPWPPPLLLLPSHWPLVVCCRLKVKKVKNVTHDELGETVGRIHMERQDFDKLTLRKTKATKGAKRTAAEMSKGSDDEGGEEEDAAEDADADGDEGMTGAAAAAPVARGGAGTGGAARGPKAKRARLAAAHDDE